jgi:hypothetical protein
MDELWEIADSLHIQSMNLKASLKLYILKVRILHYEINAVGIVWGWNTDRANVPPDCFITINSWGKPLPLKVFTPVNVTTWKQNKGRVSSLTFWCRNYFFLILAHSVYKMWIIQEPNKLELWNKLNLKEKKKRRLYTMFKMLSNCICWINI